MGGTRWAGGKSFIKKQKWGGGWRENKVPRKEEEKNWVRGGEKLSLGRLRKQCLDLVLSIVLLLASVSLTQPSCKKETDFRAEKGAEKGQRKTSQPGMAQ